MVPKTKKVRYHAGRLQPKFGKLESEPTVAPMVSGVFAVGFRERSWRIIPDCRWLITMVLVSPSSRVVGPLPNGLFMAYKG